VNRKPYVLTAIALAVLACDSSPLTPVASSVSSRQAPAEEPFTEVFEDVNPCTGNVVTYTFSGTARVRESGDDLFLVAKGTVVTSDGFTGSFNRQFIINDNVTHLRFHDMEASSQTGQRIIFGVGLFHETTVNGESVVSFEQFSGARCVGKG
jgi:hypothetical protein